MDSDIRDCVLELGGADQVALQKLAGETYRELHRLAHRQLARGPNQTLNTTGLVSEWYLRMAESNGVALRDRRHFFVLAARIMRQVLCAYSRERMAEKRGGGERPVPLDSVDVDTLREAQHFVDIDEALHHLSTTEPKLAQVVELRFFGGLSEPDTAEAMQISVRSVQRLWAEARKRLLNLIEGQA